MCITDLKKLHTEALELLEAIEAFKKRKQSNRESINGFAGEFPALRRKMLRRNDILDAAIVRMQNKYFNNFINLDHKHNSKITN